MKAKLKLNSKFIPVNTPKIFKEDKKNVNISLRDNWISSEGPFVKKFEEKFSKYNKRKYGIAVSSGTAALEISLKVLNLKKGSEVIIPTFTIISTALSVIKMDLKPVLVDSDLKNWNMLPEQIIKKINKKTKAIIITHIYGFPVDMEKILKIANKKKIKIVEDAAEMIGQKYKNKNCGSFGDLSTFSFYANKHITTGEGGMILTNDKKLYFKCKSLRNLCFGTGKERFNHDDLGWNYRMTNIQAALGLGQLKNINWIIKRKKEIGKMYYKFLKNNKKIFIQNLKTNYAENIFWVYGVLLKKNVKISRDFLARKLLKKKIQTRNFFYPMHKQKIFNKMKIFKGKMNFPNSEFLSKNGLYLPSGLAIKNNEIKYICLTLNKLLN